MTGYAGLFPDAEILVTGVEDPDTRAHGANESLDLATFERPAAGTAPAPARSTAGNRA